MMKYGFVADLGHRPSGGAGEGGLPADFGNAENALCLDRFRQRLWAGATDYYVGRLMTLGPEVKALQLRPDGLRGASNVRLVFRPHDRHLKAFGPSPIIARAGEIVPVPWCKDELQGNGVVEVYPCFQATTDAALADAHYARFALLEDDADKKDALGYIAPDVAKFSQTSSLACVANTLLTDKSVPGLSVVPCEGMRSGALVLPPSQLVSAGPYDVVFYSVFAVDPGWQAVLPIGVLGPEDTVTSLRHFAIPPGTRALLVSVWVRSAACTFDPATSGGIEILLSSAAAQLSLTPRVSFVAENLGAGYQATAGMSQAPYPNRSNIIRWQAYNTDAADAANLNAFAITNINTANGQQYGHPQIVNFGAVAAATGTLGSIATTWEAIYMYVAAATNTVDELYFAMYSCAGT